jgi:bifunctional DNA-binding transcriptional regulator/antitoxin component of YhaV-PrlF toxin-antitoxin module
MSKTAETENHGTPVIVTLRRKNQITFPDALAERLGVGAGDRLIFEPVEDAATGLAELRVRPILRSYAGIFKGLFKDEEDVAEYLRKERESWGE